VRVQLATPAGSLEIYAGQGLRPANLALSSGRHPQRLWLAQARRWPRVRSHLTRATTANDDDDNERIARMSETTTLGAHRGAPSGLRPGAASDETTGAALATEGLGKRYGRHWALRDCTVTLPRGKVAALVGPNGAGKTTLLHLCVGLLAPSVGSARVFGHAPDREPTVVLPRIGFVAQDHPLYKGFTVADMLTMGRKLNPHWDNALATRRLRQLAIPLDRRVGRLSGGQQAQLALALALGKRPDLLILDEPVASLDPLARRDFLRALAGAVAEQEVTVLLSSHIIGDLEQVCDYLIILATAQTRLVGDVATVLREHRRLTLPSAIARDPATLARIDAAATVVGSDHVRDGVRLLVRLHADTPPDALDPAWDAQTPTLEEVSLAYLERA